MPWMYKHMHNFLYYSNILMSHYGEQTLPCEVNNYIARSCRIVIVVTNNVLPFKVVCNM